MGFSLLVNTRNPRVHRLFAELTSQAKPKKAQRALKSTWYANKRKTKMATLPLGGVCGVVRCDDGGWTVGGLEKKLLATARG